MYAMKEINADYITDIKLYPAHYIKTTTNFCKNIKGYLKTHT